MKTPRDVLAEVARRIRTGQTVVTLLPEIDAALAPPTRRQPGGMCSVRSCGRRHYAKGYCSRHWQQARAGRDPHAEARLPAVAPPRPVVPRGWQS